MRHLLCLLLALVGCACASDPLAPSHPRANSVVSLLELVGPPPCMGFPEEQCRYANTWEPHCAAFAIERAGKTMLATASHCVPPGTTSASPLRFYAPSGWGHGLAHLVERDEVADVAFLAPAEPEMVTPLRVGQSPLVGDSVWSYSPIYRERSAGHVTGWLGADWFQTTQTVAAGWSGSPVLDEQGAVVGVVSRCPSAYEGAVRRCSPGHVVITAALCFKVGS